MHGGVNLVAQFAGCQGINGRLENVPVWKVVWQGVVTTSVSRSTLLWWIQEAGFESASEVCWILLIDLQLSWAGMAVHNCFSHYVKTTEKSASHIHFRKYQMAPLTTLKAADGYFPLESLSANVDTLQRLFWVNVELCFRHVIGASTSTYRWDHPPDIWCAYLSSGAANNLAYAGQIVCGRGVLLHWWVWPGFSADHPEIQEIQYGDG